MSLDFCYDVLMVGLEFSLINMKIWTQPLPPNNSLDGGDVMVWGMFSWHTYIGKRSFKFHSLCSFCD